VKGLWCAPSADGAICSTSRRRALQPQLPVRSERLLCSIIPRLRCCLQQDTEGDPYFAEGDLLRLLTGLCRIRWLHVVARASSFLVQRRRRRSCLVERQLGVRYVLQGLIRRSTAESGFTATSAMQRGSVMSGRAVRGRAGGRIRSSGSHHGVRSRCGRAIDSTCRGRACQAKPTENLDAYDLYLRALLFTCQATGSRWQRPRSCLPEPSNSIPNYSVAKAFSAQTTVIQANQGWTKDADRRAAIELAREALADHRDDPVVLRCVGHSLRLSGP
jgi:adenylate cyclase